MFDDFAVVELVTKWVRRYYLRIAVFELDRAKLSFLWGLVLDVILDDRDHNWLLRSQRIFYNIIFTSISFFTQTALLICRLNGFFFGTFA